MGVPEHGGSATERKSEYLSSLFYLPGPTNYSTVVR